MNIITKMQTNSPLRSTAVVGVMTLLSRILGMVRDIVFAHYLGANAATDAFFVAFRIPNLTRRMFAEGAFAQAFVPILAEYKTQQPLAEVKRFLAYVIGSLSVILIGMTLIAIVAAPLMVLMFGFQADQADLAVLLIRITFPYAIFISLVACAGGILNSYGKFAVPAFTPVLLNIVLIGVTMLFAPMSEQPVVVLSVGVVIAGLVQLGFQLPYLARIGLLPMPRWGWAYPGVKKIVKLMIPSIIGSSAAQINIMVGTVIATYLVSGSISWLYYADRLVEFPLGVFGIAISTVILPRLSQQHMAASHTSFSETLDWALKLVLILGTPATVGLMMLSAPLVVTIFRHGAFDPHSVHMASYSLIAYSLGLQGFILVKVLSPAFFSRQDMKTPMRFGLISIVISIIASFLLVWPFGHIGLALATSLAAVINALLLFLHLRRAGIYVPATSTRWRQLFVHTLLANIVMGVALLLLTPPLSWWFDNSILWRVGALAALVCFAMMLYGLIFALLGMRLHHLRN